MEHWEQVYTLMKVFKKKGAKNMSDRNKEVKEKKQSIILERLLQSIIKRLSKQKKGEKKLVGVHPTSHKK